MSAALFDPDDIMREVRAKANAAPPAKTANLLKDTPNFSSLAKLAALTEINSEVAEAAPRDNQTSYRVRRVARGYRTAAFSAAPGCRIG